MKQKRFLLVMTLLCLFQSNCTQAQTDTICGFDALMQSTPDYQMLRSQHLQTIIRFRQKNTLQLPANGSTFGQNQTLGINSCRKAKFLIPVVVHVIYDPADNTIGTGSNISNAQIESAIRGLNAYFANDTNAAAPATNTGIQFCLAKRDINGNNFSGITRRASTLSNNRFIKSSIDSLMALDYYPGKYLNIWVVKTISDTFYADKGIQGYATFPSPFNQGIVIRARRMGNVNDCNGCNLLSDARSTVLVHEAGHFLGLRHPFDAGCVGMNSGNCAIEGDYCCDVPPVYGQNFGCSTRNTCQETPDVNDQIANHMDYANEGCKSIFTPNQTEIMHATLTGSRAQLVSPYSINEVGLQCCHVGAAFVANTELVCIPNDTVTLTAINYASTTYRWYITTNNALVYYSSSGSNMLKYKPTTAGLYTVKLTLVANGDSLSETKTDYIEVASCSSPIANPQAAWAFGAFCGLRFTSGGPIRDAGPTSFFPDNIEASEGCISQGNAAGLMLFYAGGVRYGSDPFMQVFNNIYRIMPNGDSLLGYFSNTQIGVSLPMPGDGTRYYLIHLNSEGRATLTDNRRGIRYSVVDTTLDAGRGDIVSTLKNKPILAPTFISYRSRLDNSLIPGEGVTALPKCNGSDYWLIVQEGNDSLTLGYAETYQRLFVYSVTASGITYHSMYAPPGKLNTIGQLKASPDGRFLAGWGKVFSFDRETGTITGTVMEGPYNLIYGISFSPDSRLVYMTESTNGISIFQYDLYSADPVATRKSVVSNLAASTGNRDFQMQLGPDGKIYCSLYEGDRLQVINNPNVRDTLTNLCGFTQQGPKLSSGSNSVSTSLYGLPNMVDTKPVNALNKGFEMRPTSCQSFQFSPNIPCAASYKWYFGDGDSSSLQSPTHTYANGGSYNIQLNTPDTTVNKLISIGLKTFIAGDTLICDTGISLNYSTSQNMDYIYQWTVLGNNGTVVSPANQNNVFINWSNDTGTVRLIVKNQRTGCTDTTSRLVARLPSITGNIIGSNQTVCAIGSLVALKGNRASGGTNSIIYKWRKKLPSGDWSDIPNSNDTFYLPIQLEDSAMYVRAAISGKCEKLSNVVVIESKAKRNRIYTVQRACIPGQTFTINGDTARTLTDSVYTYQWEFSADSLNWDTIPGADSLHLNWSYYGDSVYIRRVATSAQTNCKSPSNILKVHPLIYFTRHPQTKPVCRYHGADVTVFDSDVQLHSDTNITLHYYWQLKDSISTTPWNDTTAWNSQSDNAKHTFYAPPSPTPRHDSVRCIVFTPCGKLYSKVGIIYVNPQTGGPNFDFVTHPASVNVNEGGTASFSASLNYDHGFQYYWQVSTDGGETWQNIPGANTLSLTLANVNRCQNKTRYRMGVFTGCNTLYSAAANLVVNHSFANYLMMRDATNDNGAEPYPGNNIWVSPDIWFSRNPAAIYDYNNSNIEYKKNTPTGYAKVQIKNLQSQASPVQKVVLHWTVASTLELWPKHWVNTPDNIFINTDSNSLYYQDTFPRGGVIDTLSIPSLGANKDTILVMPWQVPNPAWYGVKGADSSLMVCLLARILNCDEKPYGMKFPEGLVTADNARNNRKIITRNFHVVDTNSADWTVPIRTGNYWNQNANMALNIKIKSCNYLDHGLVVVSMDDALSHAWQENGGQGSGFTAINSSTIHITDSCNVWLTHLAYQPNQEASLKLHFITNESIERLMMMGFEVEVYQYNQDSLDRDTFYAQGGMMLRCDLPTNTHLHVLNNYIQPIQGVPYYTAVCPNIMPDSLIGSSAVTPAFWSFQWQVSTDTTAWMDIPGATGKNYQPPGETTDKYYRRKAIKQYTLETKYTPAVWVRIRNPQITSHPASVSVNEGTAVNFVVSYTDMTLLGWQRNRAIDSVYIETQTDTLHHFVQYCQNGHSIKARLQNICTLELVNSNPATITVYPSTGNPWAKDANTGSYVWNSPDMVNRHSNDNGTDHQTPKYGAANYLYVTIRNDGVSSSAPTKLQLFWTAASTGAQWNRNLRSDTSQNATQGNWISYQGAKKELGGLIGEYIIPAIAANGSTVVTAQWNPVNPAAWGAFSDEAEIGFVARIVACDDATYAMSNPETVNLGENVRGNDRVIAKSLVVTPVIPGNDRIHPAGNGNVAEGSAADGKLVLHALDCDYFRYGYILLHLDETLQNSWTNTNGSGYEVINDSTLRVDSCQDAILSSIGYGIDERAWLGVEFKIHDTTTVESITDLDYAFNLEQYMAGDDENSVGGIRYEVPIHLEPQGEGSFNIPTQNKPAKIGFSVYPNPFTDELKLAYHLPQAEQVNITVTNLLGQQVASIENKTYKTEGTHKLVFDATILKEGVYFISFQAGAFVQTRKIVLMR